MSTRRLPRVVALAVAVVLAHAGAAHAVPARLVAGLGSTFASVGDPGDGGPALSLSALWAFDPGFEAGVMVFADDLGNAIGVLVDPNDATVALGAAQEAQRWSFGAAWRIDVSGSESAWAPYASATLGYYRVQRDRLGVVTSAESANGVSFGAGLRRMLGGGAALGLSLRFHQLSGDHAERYMQATLDGSVRWGQ